MSRFFTTAIVNTRRFTTSIGGGSGLGGTWPKYLMWRYRPIETIGGATVPSTAFLKFVDVSGSIIAPNNNTGNVSGTFIASNTNASFPASNAFDGTSASFWLGGSAPPDSWVGWKFDSSVAIRGIIFSKRPDSFGQNETPHRFFVEGANVSGSWNKVLYGISEDVGSNWGTGEDSRSYDSSIVFSGGKQQWKLSVNRCQAGSARRCQFSQLKFFASGVDTFGVSGVLKVVKEIGWSTAFSSTGNDGLNGWNLFDGKNSTDDTFAQLNVDSSAVITIDYGELNTPHITSIEINSGPFGSNDAPSNFTVENRVSSGDPWSVVSAFSSVSMTSDTIYKFRIQP